MDAFRALGLLGIADPLLFRNALRATLTNQNDATGRTERIALYTTMLNDGTLFYLLGVAPDEEYGSYDSVFNRIADSLQFTPSLH